MKIRSIYFILCFIACHYTLLAQDFEAGVWYEGEVMLNSKAQEKGLIKFDFEDNSIQVKNRNKIQTLFANQFISFSVYESLSDIRRVFFVIPYAENNGYKRPQIFELLFNGKISLVARSTPLYSPTTYPINKRLEIYKDFDASTITQYVSYELFLVDDDGNVQRLKRNKKAVINAFPDNKDSLARFIKEKKVVVSRPLEMLELVSYYNELIQDSDGS